MQNAWDSLKEFLITHKQTLRVSEICIKYKAVADKKNLKAHCTENNEYKEIMFPKE